MNSLYEFSSPAPVIEAWLVPLAGGFLENSGGLAVSSQLNSEPCCLGITQASAIVFFHKFRPHSPQRSC